MNGIIDIDIFMSTVIQETKLPDVSVEKIKQTFSDYFSTVDVTFKMLGGVCWRQKGDGGIFIFPTPEDATQAATLLLDKLIGFNGEKNQLKLPLFARIGVHEIEENIKNAPVKERGNLVSPSLNMVSKLQESCPIGKIAVSAEVYCRLKHLQTLFRPSLTTIIGLSNRKFYVSRVRNIMPQEEKLFAGLPREQMERIPPIQFPIWDEIKPDQNSLTKISHFFDKSALVVLGETSITPKSPVAPAATSDAVGTMEIMALIQSNPDLKVGIAEWEDTADLVINRNILIVGSSIVNIYAFALNDLFSPTHFVKANGRVFDLIEATSKDSTEYFGAHGNPPRDSAIVLMSKSPFNKTKDLLWIAGITGMGTQAASRLVWDLVRDPSVFNKKLEATIDNPIACIVAPQIPEGQLEITDYKKRLRILDYKILWAVDKDGNPACKCEK